MERLFYKLSNASDIVSISHREGLQIIKICCCCFWWVLRHRRGHVIHTWDPGPCWRTPQICGEEFKNSQECPPPWPPPKETCKSSWRPIPSRLRVRFGIQKQPALKWTPSSHTESDMDALGMDGKIIWRRFQWSRWESSEKVDIQFLFRHCNAVFRSLGCVSC